MNCWIKIVILNTGSYLILTIAQQLSKSGFYFILVVALQTSIYSLHKEQKMITNTGFKNSMSFAISSHTYT